MATQNIKYAKKCKKIFFSQIIGGAMASFGQGVATPMVRSINDQSLNQIGVLHLKDFPYKVNLTSSYLVTKQIE